ncbi:MAG: hypothetical protein ACKN9E_04280, partial [Microcystaceae cyanobacterium]
SDGNFLISNQNQGVRFHYNWEPDRIVEAKDIILLVEENKKLVRQSQLTLADGRKIGLKPANINSPFFSFPTSVIFPHLISASVSSSSQGRASAIYLEPQK